jgi:hypothetical protein
MQDNWNTLRAQIEMFSRPFPKEAIAFANAHREEVAPHLVAALEQLVAHPAMVDENPDYILHEYAMHLLAAWGDKRAYAPLIALGHFDEDALDAVMGDSVTETYGRCLATVCGGDMAPLKALFEDTKASHWARLAALDAMVTRVIEGDDSREALVQYLTERGDLEAARLRKPGKMMGDLEVIDAIVDAACDLVAVELNERIQSWFDDGLLDEMSADKAWVARCMAMTFESSRQSALQRGKGYVRDVEAEMGWWAGFAEERPRASEPMYPLSNPHSDRAGAWGGGLPFDALPPVETVVRSAPKVGRNDPFPCGSGKKYKKCCGAS